jgi:excisionase family DNA binding protein
MAEQEYIDSLEAAKILGVSRAWVNALCRAGSLRAERGLGQGSPWRIERSSVDELAAKPRKVDREDIEAVAEEIANDTRAKELANERAEESFWDRIFAIAKKYGFGTSMVVGGVVGHIVSPGNSISTQLISEGIEIIIKGWRQELPQAQPPPDIAPPEVVLPEPNEADGGSQPTDNCRGPLDGRQTDEIMAAFRQAIRGRGWMEREEVLKGVSVVLGFERLGPKIKEGLRGHLRAAIRRKIIEADGNEVRPGTTTLADYALDDLREAFASVMRKGRKYDREEVMHAIATYLGFARLTETGEVPLKSAINSGIRQGILGYKGSEIWREL